MFFARKSASLSNIRIWSGEPKSRIPWMWQVAHDASRPMWPAMRRIVKVFSSVRRGLNPEVNAVATILVLLVSLGAVAGWWWMQREEKRRQRDMQLAVQGNG